MDENNNGEFRLQRVVAKQCHIHFGPRKMDHLAMQIRMNVLHAEDEISTLKCCESSVGFFVITCGF